MTAGCPWLRPWRREAIDSGGLLTYHSVPEGVPEVKSLAAAFLAAAAVACSTGAGELTYTVKIEKTFFDELGRMKTARYQQRVFSRPDAFRSERLDTGAVTIVLLKERRMVELDPKEKTFRSVTFDDLKALVRGHMKRIEEKLADPGSRLSPAQRRRLLGILGKRRVKVSVERSREALEILGHRCSKVTYKEDGIRRIEEWVTTGIRRSIDMTPLLEITGDFSRELLAAKRRARGFALKSIVHGRLAITPLRTSSEVLAVKEGPVDEDLFRVPEGYRRAGSPESGPEAPEPGPAPAETGPAEPEPDVGAPR